MIPMPAATSRHVHSEETLEIVYERTIALCAAVGCVGGTAHAQSSVQLYGIIDEGINYVSNASGHHLYSLASGVLNGSRWGCV